MKKIEVLGLGYADEKALSLNMVQVLESGKPIWLRTEKHPVVWWMKNKGIQFHTFDRFYEEEADFSTVYNRIVDALFQQANKLTSLIYAVPGHPMVAERTVQLLLERCDAEDVQVEVIGGISFLDGLFARLGVDPIEGFLLLDGTDLTHTQLNPHVHQVIGQVYSRLVASDIKLTLMEVYPDETPITIATSVGIPQFEQITTVPLYQMDHEEWFSDFTSIYIPPIKDPMTFSRRFDTLVYLFEYLRSPKGCPWDRKQTHRSLRPYLIEETYEFLDAIGSKDAHAMEEELGDVLLQVMLHAQIAKENGTFDIYDVMESLINKMVRRHPHVFGNQTVEHAGQVVQNWEEIKRKEKGDQKQPSIFARIPQGLPALMLADQLNKKSGKVGFDWERKEELGAKIAEEMLELFQTKSETEAHEEFGDLLFAVVSLARFFNVEPETALLDACQKFRKRFEYIERKADECGKELPQLSIDQMNQWWMEAKKTEK